MSNWSAWDAQSDPRLQRCNDALRPVVARTGIEAVQTITPVEEVCFMEDAANMTDDDAFEEGLVEGREVGRVEGFRAVLELIFRDGYHPGLSVRRLYCIANRMAPELIAEMSMADCASMFGETRAAFQARMDKMYEGTGVRSRDQKRSQSADRMAVAQVGNVNRKQGAMKKNIVGGK